jgi:hypothetical protein
MRSATLTCKKHSAIAMHVPKPIGERSSMSSAPHPFSIPDYRRYWLARFMAVIATMSMVVVIAWQVYDVARTDYGMSPKQPRSSWVCSGCSSSSRSPC